MKAIGKDNFVRFLSKPSKNSNRNFPFIAVLNNNAVVKTILLGTLNGRELFVYDLIIPFVYEN